MVIVGLSVSVSAMTPKAGCSMKLVACASCARRDWSSSRRASSSPHASARKAARWSGLRSSAESSRALSCCQRSGVKLLPLVDFAKEPQFSRAHLALDRGGGKGKDFRRFVYAEPAKKAELNNATLLRIDCGQPL